MNLLPLLPLAVALACAPSDPPTVTASAALDCSQPKAECTYAITHPWRHDDMHLRAAYICAAWLAACSKPTPNPTPPPNPLPAAETGGAGATGGTSSAGGALATGGKAAAGGTISTGGTTAQSTDALACAKLHELGCPEGADPVKCADPMEPTSMAARCRHPKVKCNPGCIIAATSKADIQTKCHIACGGL